jgi:Fe-S-cluster-containing hydrogenase component 2
MVAIPNITIADLKKLEAFQSLPDVTLSGLFECGTVRQLSARARLSSLPHEHGEKYFFLLRGVLAISLDPKGQENQSPERGSKRPPKDQQFLGYFEAGDCLSDGFLSGKVAPTPSRLDCVAVNAVTLLELASAELTALARRQPQLQQQLRVLFERSRNVFLSQQTASRRLIQDFFLRENYVTSTVVRVGRLDRCIDCNKCFDACVERHGVPRMDRFGPTLGKLSFPVVCHTCTDQPCVSACKIKGISFNASTGEVHIGDQCNGCGQCAKQCPRDAISLVKLPPLPEGVKGPKQRAVKCDHCTGFADRACLTACPTGALIEVTTEELFREVEPDPVSLIRSFSEASFMHGKPQLSPKQRRWERFTAWGGWLSVLFVLWLGVESFLIRTEPERSLLHLVVSATKANIPVTFVSGRGIGHWFGYIGTFAMLASVLYSLRTRVDFFKKWGSQKGWLAAHLWFGFVGAALVTYHAVFKLNRWASIALYLMWFVVLTGVIGRYAFGRVHTAVNLAEYELNTLRNRCREFMHGCATPRAVQALYGKDSLEGRKRFSITVMLWEEVRDRAALLWLWAKGTNHLATSAERKEMVRTFSDWAEHRRRSSYYQSAKSILRHWNIVHIVLAIIMFILAGIHVVYGFLYKAV